MHKCYSIKLFSISVFIYKYTNWESYFAAKLEATDPDMGILTSLSKRDFPDTPQQVMVYLGTGRIFAMVEYSFH